MSAPKNSPTPDFEPHRAAIRARGHRVNPYRLGVEVGRRGDDLPSPYPSGTRGARMYADGVKWARVAYPRASRQEGNTP